MKEEIKELPEEVEVCYEGCWDIVPLIKVVNGSAHCVYNNSDIKNYKNNRNYIVSIWEPGTWRYIKEPEYVEFDNISIAPYHLWRFRGEWRTDSGCIIRSFNKSGVYFCENAELVTYKELLENYEMTQDCITYQPCGVLKQ